MRGMETEKGRAHLTRGYGNLKSMFHAFTWVVVEPWKGGY
jgi:hypothetical protein